MSSRGHSLYDRVGSTEDQLSEFKFELKSIAFEEVSALYDTYDDVALRGNHLLTNKRYRTKYLLVSFV